MTRLFVGGRRRTSPYACLRWLPVWLPRNMVSLANDWCPGFSEGARKPTTVVGHRAVLGVVIGPRVGHALLDEPAERDTPTTPMIESAGKIA